VLPHSQELVEFGSFEDFVTEELLEGLGTTVDHLKNICRDDIEALDLIDKAVQEKPGKRKKDIGDNVTNKHPDMNGNSRDEAIRRLRAQRPDLHSKVLKGELSAHSAMIEAGFRQKTLSVPLDPEKLAQTIKRHFNEEQIAKLIALLLGVN
jgi:predicted exporter